MFHFSLNKNNILQRPLFKTTQAKKLTRLTLRTSRGCQQSFRTATPLTKPPNRRIQRDVVKIVAVHPKTRIETQKNTHRLSHLIPPHVLATIQRGEISHRFLEGALQLLRKGTNGEETIGGIEC